MTTFSRIAGAGVGHREAVQRTATDRGRRRTRRVVGIEEGHATVDAHLLEDARCPPRHSAPPPGRCPSRVAGIDRLTIDRRDVGHVTRILAASGLLELRDLARGQHHRLTRRQIADQEVHDPERRRR